jgi:hypothetical protein
MFQRVLTIAALVELALPVAAFFITGAIAAESNPAITVPLVFFFNLVCGAVFAVWWKRSRGG